MAGRRDRHIGEAGPAGRRRYAQFFEDLPVEPAGGCEVDFHAVFTAVSDSPAEYGLQILLFQLQGLRGRLRGASCSDQTGAGHVNDAQPVQEFQCLFIIPVQGAQGRIDTDRQTRCQRVFDAGQCFFIAGGADKAVVDFRIRRIESDLNAVQVGFPEPFAVLRCKADPVCIEAGDEPAWWVHRP